MSLDDHCFTTLILCDIFKAFDRVWHTGLLLKLKAYGIDGKLFKWFESYISISKQCVFVNNSKYTLVNTNAGVHMFQCLNLYFSYYMLMILQTTFKVLLDCLQTILLFHILIKVHIL
jgi:hypothetical protein